MASDLSELCSICYTEKPKYRCPRCKTQTCSLPCYKKHQQRASCSGKRDPAEYLKKSQLATPSGIDRDYNYLKGVESGIEHAHRDSVDRGIEGNGETRVNRRRILPDSKIAKYFASNEITVERAPQGMSRQKSNKTRTTKRGHIMWTVEWASAEGHRELQDNCLESDHIDVIYEHLQTEKRNAEKRKQNNESSSSGSANAGKKRKLSHQDTATDGGRQDHPGSTDQTTDHAPSSTSQGDANESTQLEEQTSKPPSGEDFQTDVDAATAHTAAESPTTDTSTEDIITVEKPDTQTKPKRFYYLLKTGTTSSSKVLIPLNSSQSLTQALQNRVVLEYPTIYILSQPPPSLPEGFMLEKKYKRVRKEEEKELNEALRTASGVVRQKTHQEDRTSAAAPVDANKILDMLKRDVTR